MQTFVQRTIHQVSHCTTLLQDITISNSDNCQSESNTKCITDQGLVKNLQQWIYSTSLAYCLHVE